MSHGICMQRTPRTAYNVQTTGAGKQLLEGIFEWTNAQRPCGKVLASDRPFFFVPSNFPFIAKCLPVVLFFLATCELLLLIPRTRVFLVASSFLMDIQ